MKFIAKHAWVVTLGLVLSVAAGIYSVVAPRLYEVSGTVVVHRQKVENPGSPTEDEKNRWIWVRDGMGLKESLLSDQIWLSAIQENPLLKARYETFVAENSRLIKASQKVGAQEQDLQISFAQGLLKQVNVDFTGGDSYSFIFRAKDKDPHFAKALVLTLMERAREKIVQENQKAYKASLASMRRLLRTTKNEEVVQYLRDTQKQLQVASLLFDAYSDQKVEIVRTPHIPLEAVWPKPALLILVALLFGVTAGLGVELGIAFVRNQHAST